MTCSHKLEVAGKRDEPGVPEGREMILRHEGGICTGERGARLHARVGQELGALG
jgi:hypothetical protein